MPSIWKFLSSPIDPKLRQSERGLPLFREVCALIDSNGNFAMLYSMGHPERFYGLVRSHEIMHYLLKYLDHPDYHASCAAASALGSLRFDEALPSLRKRANDPESRVALEVQRAIRMIATREHFEEWMQKYRVLDVGASFEELKRVYGEPGKIRSGSGDIERVLRLAEHPINHARVSRIVRVAEYDLIEGLRFEFYLCDHDTLVAKHHSL